MQAANLGNSSDIPFRSLFTCLESWPVFPESIEGYVANRRTMRIANENLGIAKNLGPRDSSEEIFAGNF